MFRSIELNPTDLKEDVIKNIQFCISINNELNKIKGNRVGIEDYQSTLLFIINILNKMYKNKIIIENTNYIKEYKKKEKERYENNPNEQKIYYHPEEYEKKDQIINELNNIFKEYNDDNYFKSIINNKYSKPKKIFINYFYNMFINEKRDNIYVSIKTEITFYKEMKFFKNKLNKSYNKFLNFCHMYNNIFWRW